MGWWYFDFNSDYLFILGSFHLVFTIPVLYLHIEYSVKNAGEEIEISNNEVIIRKHRQKHKFSKDDLAKIIVYKSASLDRGGIPLSAMECYHYTRLITTNGEEIIITCLMSRKLEEEVKKLSGVPYERKKSFFCTSKWK
ncbi:MAG TPA: hypothetical protein VLB84_10590 [Bacteroidia bacterium]|jgi:hypothetical protein|nr:hypothetical protein [Bacteroidia bacterium]